MRAFAGVLLIASLTLPAWLQQFVRPTNSRAAAAAGVKQYSKKDFKGAAGSFQKADSIQSNPITSYDLSTARIAAGDAKNGTSALEKALDDPTVKPDALYNRGNARLGQKEYDQAISDYKESLRLRPSDGEAKRNLEIALRKKQEQQQQQKSQTKQQQKENQQQQQQKQPQNGNESQQQKKNDRGSQMDSLLRSIAQQEREELERMRKHGSTPRRIGW